MNIEKTTVKVKPLSKTKWHGKAETEDFTRPFTLEVLVGRNGKYATGLNQKEIEEYGKDLGVNLDDKFNPDKPHEFWSTKQAWIELPNHPIVLDKSNIRDKIKIANLKASKYVANSMEELEKGMWPDAIFVMYDEEEEVTSKASKIETKNQCVLLASKMSKEKKIQLIRILENRSADNQSDSWITTMVDEMINKHSVDFIKYANMDKEELTIRSVILKALENNVLRKEGMLIYYYSDPIAPSFEEAVAWFKDPNNQEMKIRILEQLNNKK
jgi:hypothetical protein